MEMTKEAVKAAIADKVRYAIECLPEAESVRGQFATGSAARDRMIESVIVADLEGGNQWAWCTVRVSARVEGLFLEGWDSLGCCSYGSEDAFREAGYHEDLKAAALDDLAGKILDTAQALAALGLAS